jgi:hypothetical protein
VSSIVFWAAGKDGSSNYRSRLPGIALSWLSPEGDDDDEDNLARLRPHQIGVAQRLHEDDMRKADVIVGSRVAHPNAMEPWAKMASQTKGPRLVLDLDDDYFHIDPSNKTALDFWERGLENGKPIRWGRKNDKEWHGSLLDNLRINIEMSDVVTVCSTALAESIYRTTKHPNIKVVENALPAAMGTGRKYNHDPVTVGWAGTENTAAWLPMIKDVITDAALDTFGVRVYIKFIGVHANVAANLGFRFRPGFGDCLHFEPDPMKYLSQLSMIDVLLAPYRSTPFTEAKFPTKALEASALGIPIIASAIRPYNEWIRDGVDGFLVPSNKPRLWHEYVAALVRDPKLRCKIGLAARARASSNTMQDYLGVAWEEACLA